MAEAHRRLAGLRQRTADTAETKIAVAQREPWLSHWPGRLAESDGGAVGTAMDPAAAGQTAKDDGKSCELNDVPFSVPCPVFRTLVSELIPSLRFTPIWRSGPYLKPCSFSPSALDLRPKLGGSHVKKPRTLTHPACTLELQGWSRILSEANSRNAGAILI